MKYFIYKSSGLQLEKEVLYMNFPKQVLNLMNPSEYGEMFMVWNYIQENVIKSESIENVYDQCLFYNEGDTPLF